MGPQWWHMGIELMEKNLSLKMPWKSVIKYLNPILAGRLLMN